MTIWFVRGDAFQIPLPDNSVSAVITSPPYFGLRNYTGLWLWVGGSEDCDHAAARVKTRFDYPILEGSRQLAHPGSDVKDYLRECPECGARLIQQLGQEDLPDCNGWATGNSCGDCYVCHMVAIGRELWRVLHPMGQFWLNLGDSYAANRGWQSIDQKRGDVGNNSGMKVPHGLKEKDTMGVPWRVALALQAAGWYLRTDAPWIKLNSMPESSKDRFSRAHEYWFLLTKNSRYFADMGGVLVPYTGPVNRWGGQDLKASENAHWDEGTGQSIQRPHDLRSNPAGRHYRTSDIFKEGLKTGMIYAEDGTPAALISNVGQGGGAAVGHFATFPPDMIVPLIKFSTSEHGVCPHCGNPWERVLEKVGTRQRRWGKGNSDGSPYNAQTSDQNVYSEVGWRATCEHGRDPVKPIILDPFVGSGTVCMVAESLGRSAIGIDYSAEYLRAAAIRSRSALLGAWAEGRAKSDNGAGLDDLALFGKEF